MQVSDCYPPHVAQEQLTHTELRAWQALLHAHHDVVGTLDRELKEEHDLSFSEYDVLLRLARAHGRKLRMSDLAERVLLSPSGLTRLVDRLEGMRLVKRDVDASDGRVALASLTDKGLRNLKAAARSHLRGIRQHFTGRLSETQLRNVASALESIAGAHAAH